VVRFESCDTAELLLGSAILRREADELSDIADMGKLIQRAVLAEDMIRNSYENA